MSYSPRARTRRNITNWLIGGTSTKVLHPSQAPGTVPYLPAVRNPGGGPHPVVGGNAGTYAKCPYCPAPVGRCEIKTIYLGNHGPAIVPVG
eukprot:SAG22_NODE_595_length_8730_cov_4.200672_10_plen_91_part_00